MVAQRASSSDFEMSSAPVRAGDVNLFARRPDRSHHLRVLSMCRRTAAAGRRTDLRGVLHLRSTQSLRARGQSTWGADHG
jgi:hypothetical protein